MARCSHVFFPVAVDPRTIDIKDPGEIEDRKCQKCDEVRRGTPQDWVEYDLRKDEGKPN